METDRMLFRALFLNNEAIRDGHFVFTQKFHSRYLFDFGRVLFETRSTNKLLAKLYEPFQHEPITKVITANQAEGYVLAHGVAKKYNAKAFRVERKEGIIYLPTYIDLGRKDSVLIVDDGINTGNSIKQLISAVSHKGALCCGVSVCISRYPFQISDFNCRVETVFDLSRTYPIVNTDAHGCDQCAMLSTISTRLESEPLEEEKQRLMMMKMRLTLASGYAEWPS